MPKERRRKSDAVRPSAAEDRVRMPTVSVTPTHMPTVLLVEDSHDDRHMYAEYLHLQYLRAIEIDNTADALALARTADVIVTEIRVPGPFDGMELIHRLRADAATTHKPVIVLTACPFESNERQAHAMGCDEFLPKPCLPETLVATIRRHLPNSSRLS